MSLQEAIFLAGVVCGVVPWCIAAACIVRGARNKVARLSQLVCRVDTWPDTAFRGILLVAHAIVVLAWHAIMITGPAGLNASVLRGPAPHRRPANGTLLAKLVPLMRVAASFRGAMSVLVDTGVEWETGHVMYIPSAVGHVPPAAAPAGGETDPKKRYAARRSGPAPSVALLSSGGMCPPSDSDSCAEEDNDDDESWTGGESAASSSSEAESGTEAVEDETQSPRSGGSGSSSDDDDDEA